MNPDQEVEGVGDVDYPVEEAGGGSVFGQADPAGSVLGKLVGPPTRMKSGDMGTRAIRSRASPRTSGLPSAGTGSIDLRRRERQIPDDEARLVARMEKLATPYARYRSKRPCHGDTRMGKGGRVNPKWVGPKAVETRRADSPVQSTEFEGDFGLRTVPVFGYQLISKIKRSRAMISYHERTKDGRAFRLFPEFWMSTIHERSLAEVRCETPDESPLRRI